MHGHPAAPSLPAAARSPLAAPQQQLWVVERSHPGLGEYNEARALRVHGPLDVGALRRAITAVVDRHEALRTTVRTTDGRPEQVIAPPGTINVEVECVAAGGDDPEGATRSTVRAFAERPYDLHAGPLARWLVVRLSEREYVFAVGVHHIICDGFAMNVVLDEITQLLAGGSGGPVPGLPEPPAQYREFAQWQHDREADGYLDAQLRYWVDALADAPTVLSLTGPRLRPPSRAGAGGQVRYALPVTAMASARNVANLVGGTPFSVLFAAFAALVHRYTGRTDFILGTGAPGRPEPRFDNTVGFFTSVLPVRVRPAGQDRFQDFAASAAEAVFDGFDHQCAPFPRLVEVLDPDRDPSVSPLIQVVFAMWDAGQARRALGAGTATPFPITRTRARFDLAIEVVHCDGQLELVAEYDTALLDHGAVTAMVRHYDRILQQVTTAPDVTLVDLAMLDNELDAGLLHSRKVRDEADNVLPAGVIGRLAGTDLRAYHTVDGGHVVVGRAGHRVFCGPFEVQLEDIEATLRADPRVLDAAVTADGDVAVTADTGAPTPLTAYVAVRSNRPDVSLRDIAARLPRYARPAMVAVAEVPRDEHGDLNVARLAATGLPSALARLPDGLLTRVCDTWAAALGAARVEPDDDFFALGGHSMIAAQLAQQLSRELGVKVPVKAIFEYPTPAELTTVLHERHPETLAPSQPATGPADPGQIVTEAPLSTAQLEIWINEQLAADAADFMTGVTFRIRGPLDSGSMCRALHDLADRHPAWRASVHRSGDLPVLRFAEHSHLDIEVVDLTQTRSPAEEAGALVRERMNRRFDLTRPPLIRVLLSRLAACDWLLLLAQHHLITDGGSMRVLCRDLAACYAARARGDQPDLRPPATNPATYAAWEAAWLGGPEAATVADYWRQQLTGAEPLRLATGRRAGRRTGSVIRTVDTTVRAPLDALAARQRSTGFMVVTAAFAAVLADWSGQRDLLIGTTADNRDLPGAEDVLGCFVNPVALRIDVGGDPAFEALLARLRTTALTAYEHQRLPFSHVVRSNGGWTDPARMPLFQVTSDWVDYSQLELAIPGCDVEAAPVAMDASRYELSLYTARSGDRWELTLEYARDLWTAEEIAARLDQLCDVLAAAADDSTVRLSTLVNTTPSTTSPLPIRRAR
jgi:acyl carrier protein